MNTLWLWPLALGLCGFFALLLASREVRRMFATTGVGVRYLATGVRRRLGGERNIGPEMWRRAFEELGPTYIKLGQIVASSWGLFPKRYVQEFQRCLDRVEPFAWHDVERIVRAELGAPPAEVFAEFSREPIASASIAQVHAARLHDGREVVVKIQRPHIADRVDADMRILHAGARTFSLVPTADLANPVGIIEDFDTTIHQELDFRLEAANIAEFNRIMDELGHAGIRAPRVEAALSTERVLTMERFRGVRVDDVEGIKARGIDAEQKLVDGMRAWFQCMIIYGFFHGDVHAGNLMLLDDGTIGFLDFGIIGRFSEQQRRLVTQYIFAFATGNYPALGQAMLAMGSIEEKVDMAELAKDLAQVYGPMLQLSFGEIKYGELLPGILRVAIKHRMRLPNEFILVTKQMLFFDRYAKLVAPKLNVFNDPRLVAGLAQDVAQALAQYNS